MNYYCTIYCSQIMFSLLLFHLLSHVEHELTTTKYLANLSLEFSSQLLPYAISSFDDCLWFPTPCALVFGSFIFTIRLPS